MASNKDLSRSIKIYIDGSDAMKDLNQVEGKIVEVTEKINNLNQADANYATDLKKYKAELKQLTETRDNHIKSIEKTKKVLEDLSGATYKDLINVQSKLKEQLKQQVRGTAEYNNTLKLLQETQKKVALVSKDMTSEVGSQGTTFCKVANAVNQYAATIGGAIVAITGITTSIRKSVDDYAQMEEAMAGVKKYTGLTAEGVRELNEELKKMDTRTSREKLNALAGDAGRLGITSKEAILEFVDAADKINVALGEDLGEDAVKNIGKLAQMFGEDKTKGLRGAMLATGSAINEVAQSCSASESFLVDFTARVAGVANQAGISQADIMGFAASMDENMMREETSATAYQNIIMKMYTKTADFAKAAGLDVQNFAQLVKTDANEALLQFAEAMSKKGGLADLAPIFGDLKTEGAGVAAVLSVMAGKSEEIRNRQELANNAYQEGTSIINEYNVANNTVQAGIDKAKKSFLEVSIALGEKMQPMMTYLISGSSALVRVLSSLVTFVINYKGAIISAAAAMTAYNIVLNKNKIITALHTAATTVATATVKTYQGAILLLSAAKATLTGNITKATAAMRLFGIVTKANPIGAIVAVLATAAVAIYQFASKTNHAKEAVSDFTKKNIDMQSELKKSYNALISTGEGTKQRAELIEEFNNKYGGYLDNLLSEKSTLDEIKSAYDRVTIAMQRKIARQVMSEKIEEAERDNLEDKADAMQDIQELLTTRLTDKQMNKVMPKLAGYVDDLIAKGYKAKQVADIITQALVRDYKQLNNRSYRSNLKEYLEDYADEAMETYKKVSQIKKMMNPFVAEPEPKKTNVLDEVVITPGGNKATTGGTGGGTVDEKAAEKARKAAEKAAKEKAKAAEKADAELAADMKKRRDLALKEENDGYKLSTQNLKDQLDKKLITQEEYDITMAALKVQHTEKVATIESQYYQEAETAAKNGGDRIMQLTIEQKQREQSAIEAANQAKIEAERTYYANLQAIKSMVEKVDTSPEAQENATYKLKLAQLEATYQASMDYAEREGKDTMEVYLNYLNAKESLDKEHAKKLVELQEESNRSLVQAINDPLQQQVMAAFTSITNLQNLVKNFSSYTQKEFKGKLTQCISDLANSMTAALSSIFSTLQQTETANLEAQYDAQIAAAEGNSEEIERLENEKAQKKLDIEKKYADIQFAVQVAQIISNTALAVMTAFAQLGPIAGGIAGGMISTVGTIQLAAAIAQRNAVKNLTLDSSSSSSGSGQRVAQTKQFRRGKYDVIGAEDGKTYKGVPYIGDASTGIVASPALISEQGPELIVSAPDLARLQQHVNYPLVIDAINESRRGGSPIPQHASGNYSSVSNTAQPTASSARPSQYNDRSSAVLDRLSSVLEKIEQDGISAGVSITEIEKQQRLRDKSRKKGSKNSKS